MSYPEQNASQSKCVLLFAEDGTTQFRYQAPRTGFACLMQASADVIGKLRADPKLRVPDGMDVDTHMAQMRTRMACALLTRKLWEKPGFDRILAAHLIAMSDAIVSENYFGWDNVEYIHVVFDSDLNTSCRIAVHPERSHLGGNLTADR